MPVVKWAGDERGTTRKGSREVKIEEPELTGTPETTVVRIQSVAADDFKDIRSEWKAL